MGFLRTGELVVNSATDSEFFIEYTDKTINQFLNCSGVTQEINATQEIALNSYAYASVGITTTNIVTVRITGVLSDLDILDKTYYYEKNDIIQIKSLGSDLNDHKANNWFFNVSTRHDVKSLELIDVSNFTYKVNLYDDHDFVIGDSITLISSDSREFYGQIIPENITSVYSSSITGFDNKTSFNISGQGQLNTSSFYTVRKNISKVSTLNYSEIEKYTSNVQNVYTDLNDSLYAAANSFPSYYNNPLEIVDRSITFSGSFSGTQLSIGVHNFATGDAIIYNPTSSSNKLDLFPGIYFVKKVDNTTISIARSRENIYTENFITISGTVTNNKFFLLEFSDGLLNESKLQPQKLIRKFSTPVDDTLVHTTPVGSIGIFVNGVELTNYKSNDYVFYGPIENVIVTSPGSGYDIVSTIINN